MLPAVGLLRPETEVQVPLGFDVINLLKLLHASFQPRNLEL